MLIVRCNHTSQPGEPVNKTTDSITAPVLIRPIDTIYAGDRDTAIQLKKDEVFITGHIIANKNQPKYAFSGRKGQTVTAILKPLKKAGIRKIYSTQIKSWIHRQ